MPMSSAGTTSFDDVFRSDDAEVPFTLVQAARANTYAERWVRTVRAECLNWLLIVGRSHLEQLLRVYVQHTTATVPHRALWFAAPGVAVSGRRRQIPRAVTQRPKKRSANTHRTAVGSRRRLRVL
jgi:hypothetical protein